VEATRPPPASVIFFLRNEYAKQGWVSLVGGHLSKPITAGLPFFLTTSFRFVTECVKKMV
jgi:hypothetical protein